MPCEHFKDALTAAAASNAAPDDPLRAHLEVCAPCRAAFTEEQSPFNAIDGTLRGTVNEEMPASLLPRVRARLQEEAAPNHRWVFAWSALASSALLAAALLFMTDVRHKREPQVANLSQGAAQVVRSQTVSAPREIPPKVSATQASRQRRVGLIAPRIATTPEQPEVLVPAGQEKVVALLIQDLRRGEINGEALIADARKSQLDDLRILPMNVSPLEVKPLEEIR